MIKRKLIVPIIIILGIMISLAGIHTTAATGDTIYFSPNNTAAPSIFGGTITITIMADTVGTGPSSGINGWDLVVTDSDPGAATLSPASVSKTGNLLEAFGQVSETINCVNGGSGFTLNQPGNIGCDARDGPGIVHTSAVLQGPATSTPVSGRIARITYTTVGAGPLTIGILAPCPASPAGSCDILIDGSPSPVPHTTLTATYGTPAPPGDFKLSAPNGTAPGSVSPGASATTLLNLTSLSGATGSVSFTQTTYPSSGLTFSCATVTLIINSGVSSTCTYSSKVPGTYLVTVNATNTGTPSKFHLAPITITISDFKATSNVSSLGVLLGDNTGFANITATSINGFSGSLTISGKATPPPPRTGGLTVSCSPTTISITPTSTAQSKCIFTTLRSDRYNVVLTANYSFTGGFVARNVGITVVVQAFQITTNPGLVVVGASKTGSSIVTVSSYPSGQGSLGFSGSVAITTAANDTRLAFSCPSLSGQTVTVTPSAAASGACNVGSGSFGKTPPGDYGLVITGTFTRGTVTVTNSTRLVVTVTPDFTIFASAATMSSGTLGNSTVTITGYGITTPISLTYGSISAGLTCPNEPASITPNNTAILGCRTTSTATGQLNVSITAKSGSITHIVIATFTTGPDIAVTNVTVSTSNAHVGDKITVTVTVKYNGTGSNFQILIKWGSITVATANETTSGPGPTDYQVTWDTTGLGAGTNTVSATAPPLTVGSYTESTLNDNTATGPSVTLQQAQTSPLSGATLYAIIGVVIAAAAGAGAYVFLRRSRGPTPPATPAPTT